MTKTFLIIALFISLLSCFSKSEKEIIIPAGYSRLGIQLDSNENFFVDSIGVSPNIDQRSCLITPDKEFKHLIYVFDSIPNGRLTFSVASLFNKTYFKEVTLISDSIFFVPKANLFDFVIDTSLLCWKIANLIVILYLLYIDFKDVLEVILKELSFLKTMIST